MNSDNETKSPSLLLSSQTEELDFDNQLTVTPLSTSYHLCGKVIHGFKRGSKLLGCPTANLDPICFKDGQLPTNFEEGVYCGFASINKGTIYKTVLSIGLNPTFQTKERTVEAHLLYEFEDDFYDQELTLIIVGFLRKQEDFSNISELIKWIQRDIRISAKWLQKENSNLIKIN